MSLTDRELCDWRASYTPPSPEKITKNRWKLIRAANQRAEDEKMSRVLR
jgi:hypothetical protein